MTLTESRPTTTTTTSGDCQSCESNSKKVVRFYIIRHGQTDFNERGLLQGHYNSQLNHQGHTESALLGVYFKQEGIRADTVWSSDLDRCRSTTINILKPTYGTDISTDNNSSIKPPEIFYTPKLRERSIGELETMTMAAAKKHAAAAGKNMADYGEAPTEVLARVHATWPVVVSDALDRQLSEVLVVTHGGYIKMLLKYMMNAWGATVAPGVSLAKVRHPPNTSFTVVEVPLDADRAHPGKNAVITEFCSTPHLKDKHKVNQVNFEDGQ